MILTDREIKLAIATKLITIDPPPRDDAFSSTALDLTLDPHITLFMDEDGSGPLEKAIDPTHKDFKPEQILAEISETVAIPPGGFLLKRHTLILAWTAEYVNLLTHNRGAARVEGKSSLARLGLGVHITAPNDSCWFRRPYPA